MKRTLAVLGTVLALVAGACSDDSPSSSDNASPSPTVSLSPTPSVHQTALATLAGRAAKLRYDAVYKFTAPATKDSGTLRIVAAQPYFRLDVVTGGTTAMFIVTPTRTVTCNIKQGKKTCFLVARKGEKVPELFDPGIQRLFADAVRDLAANPMNYTVALAPKLDLPGQLPTGKCFQVDKAPGAPGGTGPTDPTGFETGRYCFAPNGLLTGLVVATGRVTLTQIRSKPTAKEFVPIAPVATLPKLPTPTPKPKPSATRSPSASASASPSPTTS